MSQKVLIVEDTDWIAEDLSEILIDKGFQVSGRAKSFEEALLLLKKEQVDVVILDIQLEGAGTGIDLAQEINDRWKIPFIFLSANIGPDTISDVLDEAPHSILTKPCKPADLITAIQLALTKGQIEIKEQFDEQLEESFFVKSEYAYQKINLDQLLFIKGEGNYTKIQLENERLVLRASLKDFAFLEKNSNIFRVHRSYLINRKHIDKIHGKFIEIKEFEVPMSAEGKAELIEHINTVR